MKYELQPYMLDMGKSAQLIAMTIVPNSGIGYYTDPAIPEDQRGLSFSVNGKSVRVPRPGSDEHLDRYVPTHLCSGDSFGVFFHQESQAQDFIEQILKKSKQLHLNWNLSVDDLVKHPAWGEMGRFVHEVAEKIARGKVASR